MATNGTAAPSRSEKTASLQLVEADLEELVVASWEAVAALAHAVALWEAVEDSQEAMEVDSMVDAVDLVVVAVASVQVTAVELEELEELEASTHHLPSPLLLPTPSPTLQLLVEKQVRSSTFAT